MITTGENGVLYVATGDKHIRAALRSARSVREHNPNLAIHLFSNWQDFNLRLDQPGTPFTSFEHIENPHRRSKVDYMGRSPFSRTLYLDNDTRVLADITSLFAVLDRFDIALCHAHLREARRQPWRIPLPDGFPQFNSGVIAYRNSAGVQQLLQDWEQAYHEAGFKSDQITLRELIWLSDLRVATLPPEYNLNRWVYRLIWKKGEAKARILHLHFMNKGIRWFLKRVLTLGR